MLGGRGPSLEAPLFQEVGEDATNSVFGGSGFLLFVFLFLFKKKTKFLK